MSVIEHPGWMCPTCGAWDSGTVMPRRAQWCDGACSHPRVAMEAVSFVRADVYQGAVAERDRLRAENERLKAERQAVLDVVNLYGDETLQKALDDIGWPSVPELVERSRALGPVTEAQGERVAQGLREVADRMRGGE
jgi:hypothetical protein